MSKRKCYRCGKDLADGYAEITVGGVTEWYCHGKNLLPDCLPENQSKLTGHDWCPAGDNCECECHKEKKR